MRTRIPPPAYPTKTPELERLRPFFDAVYRIITLELPELLTATKTWDPPSAANGASTSTTLPVPGAVVGQPVAVGFSVAVPAGALLVGAVTALNTVTVTLMNHTGGALNLTSGTLRACVWAY
jgi:hypothetical protein